MSVLNKPHFHDEKAAYAFVESHVWPESRICPHCGSVDRSGPLAGKSTRIGTYKCYGCRKPFTVKVGTIFEGSHVALHLWLQAMFLICSSKKGISSNQLHRTLGVTLKTAWFMSHRIREAFPQGSEGGGSMGGKFGVVEVDETFLGRDPDQKPPRRGKVARGIHHKMKILSLIDRDAARARSMVVDDLNAKTLMPLLRKNIKKQTVIVTDEAKYYRSAEHQFAGHEAVNHGIGEYGRGDVHTNTVEGFFSVFKRGMKGTYQHCAKKHLHRYLAEFDFRYNERKANGVDDEMRTLKALKGIRGKRLTYRTTYQQA